MLITVIVITVCLTDEGKVITMGQNQDAQLGRGHARSFSRSNPETVKIMADKEVTLIAAGSSFTVVGMHYYIHKKVVLSLLWGSCRK